MKSRDLLNEWLCELMSEFTCSESQAVVVAQLPFWLDRCPRPSIPSWQRNQYIYSFKSATMHQGILIHYLSCWLVSMKSKRFTDFNLKTVVHCLFVFFKKDTSQFLKCCNANILILFFFCILYLCYLNELRTMQSQVTKTWELRVCRQMHKSLPTAYTTFARGTKSEFSFLLYL